MAIVGFEQDPHPDAPPGAGYAIADSGERAYVYDPNLAAQFQPPATPPPASDFRVSDELMAAAEEPEDQRLAFNGGGRQGYNPQGPPPPPRSVADVGPNMSGGPPQAQPSANVSYPGDIANESSAGPNQSVQPPQAPPQGPLPEVDPDEQLRAQLQAGVNAPVYQAPVKGGLRPKSAEVTSEGAEAPMTQADWQELQDANEAIAQTQVTKAAVLRAQAEQQIAQAQAQMPALQQQYEENKAQYEAARSAAKQDLAKVNGLLQEVNAKKVDHGRFFARRGAFGALAAGVAQALGASAAILGGTGRNIVADQINRMIDEDVAEQREEIENGRANASNALQMLRDRYNFDIPQAESALKIAQLGVVNAQLKEYEGMKMSQDAQVGLEAWFAQNKKDQFLEARKLYTASMGKQTRKESLTYQQGSAGGYRAPTDAERSRRLDLIEKGQKVGAIQKPGEGDTKIPESLIIESLDGSQVKARTENEAVKIRDMRGLQLAADKTAKELERLSAESNSLTGSTFSPTDRKKYAARLEHLADAANTLFGQGMVKGDDIKRYRDDILGDQYGIGAAAAVKEFRDIVNDAYQSKVDSQRGAAVKEESRGGKAPRARYTGGKAASPMRSQSQSTDLSSPDALQAALKEYAK